MVLSSHWRLAVLQPCSRSFAAALWAGGAFCQCVCTRVSSALPMPASSADSAGLAWAQRRSRSPDAGREIQALLRWDYSHGWVDLQRLRDDHRRLQVFSRATLESAALNSRHRGGFRFQVSRHEGRTVIALRCDLLQPRRARAAEGGASPGAAGARHDTGGDEGGLGPSRGDTEAAEAPADGTDFGDDDSVADASPPPASSAGVPTDGADGASGPGRYAALALGEAGRDRSRSPPRLRRGRRSC